jgi:hypothetical protein
VYTAGIYTFNSILGGNERQEKKNMKMQEMKYFASLNFYSELILAEDDSSM